MNNTITVPLELFENLVKYANTPIPVINDFKRRDREGFYEKQDELLRDIEKSFILIDKVKSLPIHKPKH